MESGGRVRAMEEGGGVATVTLTETGVEPPTTVSSSPPENITRFQSLNWGVWGCFIFITILLVPSHIYLRKYDYRGEFLGIFFVLTLFLLCFSVPIFYSKSKQLLLHRLQMEEEMQHIPSTTTLRSPCTQRRRYHYNAHTSDYTLPPIRRVHSTPDLQGRGTQAASTASATGGDTGVPSVSGMVPLRMHRAQDHSWDPPPYHIALLLPTPADCYVRRCETPPPSYEHIQ